MALAFTVDQLVPAGSNYRDLAIVQNMATIPASNLPLSPLNTGELIIIDHETGNPYYYADGLFHSDYVVNGGGPFKVSYHFTVDRVCGYQMIPCNNIGYHAGDGADNRMDDEGAFRGIAIEVCINDAEGSPGWLKTMQNLVKLIACICSNDPRIDYGGRAGDISPKRIKPHFAVSDPGPDQHDCPQRQRHSGMIKADGSGVVQDAVLKIMGMTPPTKIVYAPVILPPWWTPAAIEDGENRVYNGTELIYYKTVSHALRGTPVRQLATPDAAKVRPNLKVGEEVHTRYKFRTADKVRWIITKYGSRIRADALSPVVKF